MLFFDNFPAELRPDCGASFRLPLRRDSDDSDNSLGAVMSVEKADLLLSQWVDSLKDGKLLLFLANVEEVSIWRWAKDAPRPTLMQSLRKRYLKGGAFNRLPNTLPPLACETYTALSEFLASQNWQELQALSCEHVAEVVTTVTAYDYDEKDESCNQSECKLTWLTTQRFNVENVEVIKLLAAGCKYVPIVSVAVSLDHGSTGVEESPSHLAMTGAAFCSLPIGSLQTHLPVHLNASFAVHKNRRSLWYEDITTITDGDKHALWSRWNRLLLNSLRDDATTFNHERSKVAVYFATHVHYPH